MKASNPTRDGACNWDRRERAQWKTFPAPLGELVSWRRVSTPNGQSYGVEGHVPCNHKVEFVYEHGQATYDGYNWTVQRSGLPRVA